MHSLSICMHYLFFSPVLLCKSLKHDNVGVTGDKGLTAVRVVTWIQDVF